MCLLMLAGLPCLPRTQPAGCGLVTVPASPIRCCQPAAWLCRVLADYMPQLYYVGCGGQLLLDSEGNIDRQLMPDALHPSAAGHDRMFSECWDAAIEGILRAGTAPESRR